MDELRELYQEVILDHNKNPKNFKKLEPASHTAQGYNPLCGDQINLFLQIDNGKIEDVGFQGSGCAISKASASMMTTLVKGKTVEEAEELFKRFQGLVTGQNEVDPTLPEMDRMAVFAGVREFPIRVKCAALAWHTLIEAFDEQENVVTTE